MVLSEVDERKFYYYIYIYIHIYIYIYTHIYINIYLSIYLSIEWTHLTELGAEVVDGSERGGPGLGFRV